MAVIDHPLIIAYEEETSFPCRRCGHLYYSETELHRLINGFHGDKRRWYCQHCHKEFRKDRNKLLDEGHCSVLDKNMSPLIAISIHEIVSNDTFLTKVYNFICIFIF